MSPFHCDKEHAIVEAVRSDQWNEDLRSHAAQCPVCWDIALVAQFMQLEAAAARPENPPPDPAYIWWRAQLQGKRDIAKRALRPIAVAEKVAYICGALFAAGVLAWKWPQIPEWLDRLKSLWAQNSFAGSQTNLLALVGSGMFLLLLFPLIALYVSWLEE